MLTRHGTAPTWPYSSECQRRYTESLPEGAFEIVDSRHFIQAEQPAIVADQASRLLGPGDSV